MAPDTEQVRPTSVAMMTSNGHKLCEVGSWMPSISVRAKTAATTETVTVRIALLHGTMRYMHSSNADMTATDRPGCSSASGKFTLAYGMRQKGKPTDKKVATEAIFCQGVFDGLFMVICWNLFRFKKICQVVSAVDGQIGCFHRYFAQSHTIDFHTVCHPRRHPFLHPGNF